MNMLMCTPEFDKYEERFNRRQGKGGVPCACARTSLPEVPFCQPKGCRLVCGCGVALWNTGRVFSLVR